MWVGLSQDPVGPVTTRHAPPPVVAPLPEAQCQVEIPANALVLDADQWTNPNWKFDKEGVMPRGLGHNPTKQEFGNAQIHLEFRFDPAPESEYEGKSQLYGNSGIFLMSAYELQVLNSFQNDTFADGSCGSVYGQHPPLVNSSRAPGNWQSYDILYKAPVFETYGSLAEPMRLTVHHNGHLIHNDAWIYGEVGGPYKAHGKRP